MQSWQCYTCSKLCVRRQILPLGSLIFCKDYKMGIHLTVFDTDYQVVVRMALFMASVDVRVTLPREMDNTAGNTC